MKDIGYFINDYSGSRYVFIFAKNELCPIHSSTPEIETGTWITGKINATTRYFDISETIFPLHKSYSCDDGFEVWLKFSNI